MNIKAFSLVEILMGIGLITLLLTIGPLILAGTFNSSKKSAETGKVKEIGASALNILVQKIKFAKEATCNGTGQVLTLKLLDNTTVVFTAGGNLKVNDGTGDVYLVASGVQPCPADNYFSCNNAVEICFIVNNLDNSTEESAQTRFQTQVQLRNVDL